MEEDPPPPYDVDLGEKDATGGSGARSRQNVGLNLAFVKTPPGLLMLINMVLLFLAWCIMAGWRGDVLFWFADRIAGATSFFLFTTVAPWLLLIVIFFVLLFGLHTKLTIINWPISLAINCCIWAFLLLISSSVVASKTDDDVIWTYNHVIIDQKYSALRAAAAFGFFSMIGLLIQAFFHFREFRAL